MSKFNFKYSDLDKDLLEKQIEKNVESIYSSPEARKGRTRAQVRQAVSTGIPCEVALMQFHNATNFGHKYGDVISPEGVKVECKASTYPWNDTKIKQMRDKIKSYNPSDVIMFWQKVGDDYVYQGFIKMKG